MTLRPQTSASGNWQIMQLVDGTDHGLDAQAVVDLLHEGVDCLRYFRCRAATDRPRMPAGFIYRQVSALRNPAAEASSSEQNHRLTRFSRR